MRHFSLIFLLLLKNIRIIGCVGNNTKNIRLLGLLPITGKGWVGGAAVKLPVKLALEDIRANGSILPGYNITYDFIDSQCSPGIAVYRMFEKFHTEPPYHMVLGDGCSTGSEATSQVSYLWNLTQLSFGSSSPILSDRTRFPKFYRLAVPDQKLNDLRIHMMKNLFNWNIAATIHQAEEFFSVVTDDFVEKATANNITLLSQEIFMHDPHTRVKNLKNNDARIIMTAMYEDRARSVLCAAYKEGLFGPKIVWVFVGWFSTNFWLVSDPLIDCTPEQMALAAEGAFLSSATYYNPVDETGVGGMTASEYLKRWEIHPDHTPDLDPFKFVLGQSYDHIWMAALALDCADKKLRSIGHPKTIGDFTYKDSDIGEIVFQCMGNQSIIGMSGRISFAKGGADPDKSILLQRIQGGHRINLGYYRQDTYPNRFDWIPDALKWKDNKIPRDSTFVIHKEIVIPPTLYITICVFAGLGIILSFLFLSFNIYYRNNRNVKLSSPNINNVLLFGCVLCYVTVFIRPTENVTSATCKARAVCFCLAFTITFSALFSKTWRVYRIFTNKKLLRRTIKDIQLFAIIAIIVMLLTAILIVWQLVSPFQVEAHELDFEKDMVGNDVEVRFFVQTCVSKQSTYFVWTIYIIEGMMLSFGAFLAWETRHVKIEALNDSHHIGLCLYNVVILSAVGLTLSLVLENQMVLLYGITSGFLIFGTTLTQLFVFVPKVHAVLTKVDCSIKGVTATANTGQGRSQGNASTFPASDSAPEN
ncbi:hypothetical protein DPMN_119558 [Dreissena polymorpha]|uniref:Gamma-aminobutyric acid type B receptor subunit 2 n=1 Tax=Dreissena polymorpha TaxID=45954 RepID=A0A9D4GJE3_DREPO|nr:hypothetical protein DPMN_119558 [Dreissena polymorpha]